jgi:hypothetical protein
VFIKKVSPGDSLSIETVFGLRAQPMIFPVQTNMRADVHYFYVRNRTLWKDWMDFYGKTKDNLVHPYIERPVKDFKTGSIYDYLGVPTTILADSIYSDVFAVNPFNLFDTRIDTQNSVSNILTATAVQGAVLSDPVVSFNRAKYQLDYAPSLPLWLSNSIPTSSPSLLSNLATSEQGSMKRLCYSLSPFPLANLPSGEYYGRSFPTFFEFLKPYVASGVSFNDPAFRIYYFLMKSSQDTLSPYTREIFYSGVSLSGDGSVNSLITAQYSNGVLSINGIVTKYSTFYNENYLKDGFDLVLPVLSIDSNYSSKPSFASGNSNVGGIYRVSGFYADRIIDTSELNGLPWCGNNKTKFISALPYRAYQAIYNSFYRNIQNDPFLINGTPEYNKYITNDAGGADSTPYKIELRNWELDPFTSAVQRPQQGIAPLVGVTISGDKSSVKFEFQSEELEQAGVPEGKVSAITSLDEDGYVTGIQYYDPDLPHSNLQRLMETISYGISINDIRQVNSFQRWLEKNIRRGYRYKDQLESHFGVKVSFNDLLMPEFIGGCSQNVETQTIYQTVTNENGFLGDYAGKTSVIGSSRNRVSKYCDEAGFIIGIMSIVPTPVYSQVPAGFVFDNDLFDYYFPEFGKIGMQPIFNYQVTPLQCTSTELDEVFGYQRPYWDLISSIDEAHGEFRTSANGYLIHRQFADKPVLNGNFLKIDNRYINDVFVITDTEMSDQFMGQIHFKLTKKTAIPLHGEPSLE